MLNQEVSRFLDSVASRTPTPGGGAVAALAGAMACSLARMVATYSMGSKVEPSTAANVAKLLHQLKKADELLRRLVSEDAAAYERYSAALKLNDSPYAKQEKLEAVRTAIAVPMQIAAVASSALACMDELKSISNRHLLSDLAVAAILADSAALSARYFVVANAKELPSTSEKNRYLAEIDQVINHCRQRRESIATFVSS